MTSKYEIELLKFSSMIKEKVLKLSKKHKILESIIYEDLDVLLSDMSGHFEKKLLDQIKDSESEEGEDVDRL